MAEFPTSDGPVLHVVVIGFHHKKGCQVEYSYPPLVEGQPVNSHEIPVKWKYLPSLALPDGSHNYESDTIYFHLPSEEDDKTSVYGVSCYRQMNASDLLNRGSDVTRNTVQKSVCVLSKLPLYGLIRAKLELITHAYFDERDFSQVSLLEETHRNLNIGLTASLVEGSQVFLGFPCRDIVYTFKHKVLILFKLMMLERRVLYFGTPVQPVCTTLLAILSLFPEMIEQGMKECSKSSPRKQLSPTLKVTKVSDSIDSEDYLEVHYSNTSKQTDQGEAKVEIKPKQSPSKSQPKRVVSDIHDISAITHIESVQCRDETHNSDEILSKSPHSKGEDILQHVENITHIEKVQDKRTSITSGGSSASYVDESLTQEEAQMLDNENDCFSWEDDRLLLEIDDALESSGGKVSPSSQNHLGNEESASGAEQNVETDSKANLKRENEEMDHDGTPEKQPKSHSLNRSESGSSIASTASNISAKAMGFKHRLAESLKGLRGESRESSVELDDMRPVTPTTLPSDNCGFPLNIFTKGVICHPYLSLQYYDILQDPNVRGFVVGASNILYKQRRNALDAIVEVSEAKIDILDPELRKQLTLTTADLRFAENLVKSVTDNHGDELFDETGWEGGDEWIRLQFRIYLQSFLATARYGDEKAGEDFNGSFVQAWKTTNNYKQWRTLNPSGLAEVQPLHPCHGQMSVADMKLRLSHNLQSTERGKKVNAAISQTGKVVMQTGKVVGGAFNSARSAVSSWFRSWSLEEEDPTTDSTQNPAEQGKEDKEEMAEEAKENVS